MQANLDFQNTMAEHIREKTPTRWMFPNGKAFLGELSITHDLSAYTNIPLFKNVGATCKALVRLSDSINGNTEQASAKGFSVKMYTEDGIWDLVGSSSPVFYLKEPQLFPQLMAVQQKTGKSSAMYYADLWAFYAQHPETLHQVIIDHTEENLGSDWECLNAYAGHAFGTLDSEGKVNWLKFHWKKTSPITSNSIEEDIENGNFPVWELSVQVMSAEQAEEYRWNPFDATKVWLHEEFPLMPLATLELKELPNDEYLAERTAFSPAHMLSGLYASPDEVLRARISTYADAHRYRLGSRLNAGDTTKNQSLKESSLPSQSEFDELIKLTVHPAEDDHYTQPGLLYSKVLTETQREALVKNIITSMRNIAEERKQEIIGRQLCHFFRANLEMGYKIASGLGFNIDHNILNHGTHAL